MQYIYLFLLMLAGCQQSTETTYSSENENPINDQKSKSTFIFEVSARTTTLDNSYSFWPEWASLDNATIDKVVLYEPGFGNVSVDPGDNNTDKIIKSYTLTNLIEQGSQSIELEIDDCTVQTVDLCVIPTDGYLNTFVQPAIYGDCSEISFQCEALYRCTVNYLVNYQGFSLFGETDFRKAVGIECI